MRVLIDTNIIIYREDSKEIPTNIQTLIRLLTEIKTTILVHPVSIQDLERNKDDIQKSIMISKILVYTPLVSPPDPSGDIRFLSRLKKPSKVNDHIDNVILYALYRDAADFLITEDSGIHRNARQLKIDNRVLTIGDAIEIFNKYSQKHDVITPPALRPMAVYNLDINDPFFNSLKERYSEFEEIWFPKICRDGRKCFANYQNNRIGALLIYNIEDNEGIIDSVPPLPQTRRLKLCTFKVTHNGQKIGELFIKLAIQIALKNDISEIYLTLFSEENDRLIDLLLDFGFFVFGKKTNGEYIFLKKILGNNDDLQLLSAHDFDKKYYPSFYDGVNVKKFIIPIQPEYLERLFTDLPHRQSGLLEHNGDFYSEGNAIKKAYITRSRSKKIHPGDIILFYRSKKDQAVTTLGVVERTHSGISNNDDILKLVAKQTVYSKEELEKIPKPVSLILFKYHFHFPKPVSINDLINEKLIESAPQSVTVLRQKSYRKIKEIGAFDERFAFS
jgi:hypothetical protein